MLAGASLLAGVVGLTGVVGPTGAGARAEPQPTAGMPSGAARGGACRSVATLTGADQLVYCGGDTPRLEVVDASGDPHRVRSALPLGAAATEVGLDPAHPAWLHVPRVVGSVHDEPAARLVPLLFATAHPRQTRPLVVLRVGVPRGEASLVFGTLWGPGSARDGEVLLGPVGDGGEPLLFVRGPSDEHYAVARRSGPRFVEGTGRSPGLGFLRVGPRGLAFLHGHGAAACPGGGGCRVAELDAEEYAVAGASLLALRARERVRVVWLGPGRPPGRRHVGAPYTARVLVDSEGTFELDHGAPPCVLRRDAHGRVEALCYRDGEYRGPACPREGSHAVEAASRSPRLRCAHVVGGGSREVGLWHCAHPVPRLVTTDEPVRGGRADGSTAQAQGQALELSALSGALHAAMSAWIDWAAVPSTRGAPFRAPDGATFTPLAFPAWVPDGRGCEEPAEALVVVRSSPAITAPTAAFVEVGPRRVGVLGDADRDGDAELYLHEPELHAYERRTLSSPGRATGTLPASGDLRLGPEGLRLLLRDPAPLCPAPGPCSPLELDLRQYGAGRRAIVVASGRDGAVRILALRGRSAPIVVFDGTGILGTVADAPPCIDGRDRAGAPRFLCYRAGAYRPATEADRELVFRAPRCDGCPPTLPRGD